MSARRRSRTGAEARPGLHPVVVLAVMGLLVLLSSFGCGGDDSTQTGRLGGGDDDDDTGPVDDDAGTDDDNDDDTDDDGDESWDSVCGTVNDVLAGAPIVFHEDFDFTDNCLFDDSRTIPYACDECGNRYLYFQNYAPPETLHPLTEEEVQERVDDPASFFGPLITEEIPYDDLQPILRTALNIDWLLDDTEDDTIDITVVDRHVRPDACEQTLIFDDPYVGKFAGLFLMPRSVSGEVPAILAVHGHGDRPAVFDEDFFGNQYPSRGYGILMISSRDMCPGEYEDLVSRTLLGEGFSFLALQVYEHSVMLRFLDGLRHVGKLGTRGHSGGAVATNVTCVVDPLVEAHAYDSDSTYIDWLPGDYYSHAMVPPIWRYNPPINGEYQPELPPVPRDYPPRLIISYEPTQGSFDEMMEFFDTYLR